MNREKDVRLHELLYGVKPEMRYCQLNDADEWCEWQSSIEDGIPGEETWWRERLPKWKQHPDFMHPCYWDSEFKRWWVVPCYCEDIAAAFEAEGKLHERGVDLVNYRYALAKATNASREYDDGGSSDWDWWDLHRATPEQRVDAMLAVLEAATK